MLLVFPKCFAWPCLGPSLLSYVSERHSEELHVLHLQVCMGNQNLSDGDALAALEKKDCFGTKWNETPLQQALLHGGD